VPFIGLIKFF